MLAYVAAVSFCVLGVAAEKAAEKPNIVLVMADDQGWGDVGYNGKPVLLTPNLDKMAAEALRFDRFYAAAPVCSPTRGSVLTGRHPNRFGCFSFGGSLRPQEITLAEAMKTAGYATGHFGKWHLGSVREGSPVNPGASGFDAWVSSPNYYDNNPILSDKGTAVRTEGEGSMVTVDAALEFIRASAARKEPFLAVVWFGSPHLPHRALEEDRRLYPDQSRAAQNYFGEITAMDRAIGKLRGELKTLGIDRNTILWYTSDNGGKGPVSSTGGRGQKGQLYEGGLLVPAILEWPEKVPGPRTTDVRCDTSDIYPTLLDIVGVTMPNQPPLDGVSLVPLIQGEMKERPKPMGFWVHPGGERLVPSYQWMAALLAAQQAGGEPDDADELLLDAGKITKQYPEDVLPGHSAWTDGDWKLHRIADNKGDNVRFELYDLVTDPKEADDRIEAEADRAPSG